MIDHKVVRLIVALAIGIFLSLCSYQMITDPEPAMERAREEAAVLAAREIVSGYISRADSLEIVDPLAPNRIAGKSYIYPATDGWQVSGYYRRNTTDPWHPYLLTIDESLRLQSLSVSDGDAALGSIAASDPRLSVTP